MENTSDVHGSPESPIRPTNTSNRRVFLLRSSSGLVALGGVPGLLAACGGSNDGGAATKVGGTLNYLSFEGYDLPEQMARWKKANGVRLAPNYTATPDDVTAKLKSAPRSGVDLTTYDSPRKPILEELDLLQEIDEEKIPNLSRLAPYFREDPDGWWKNSNGNRIGVPWSWGVLGLNYHAGRGRAPSSYHDLLDPDLRGKIVVIDGGNDVFSTTAKALGIDMTTLTEPDFEKIKAFATSMLRQAAGLATSWGDIATQLASGQAVASYPGAGFIPSLAAEASKNQVKFVIPREGGITFFDAWAVPKGADNAETAHAWINETLRPATNARACNYLAYATSVTDAIPLLDSSLRRIYPHGSAFDQFINDSPFYKMPPVESESYITYPDLLAAWEDIKARA